MTLLLSGQVGHMLMMRLADVQIVKTRILSRTELLQ